MNFLVTGVAGFIGFHLVNALAKKKNKIIGVDNLNTYYDVTLKKNRINKLKEFKNFSFLKSDIQDKNLLLKLKRQRIDCLINLAAQAGVRHSFKDPYSYINSNILGHLNIMEIVKNKKIKKFIYASSSSVYGGNKKTPFSVSDRVDAAITEISMEKRKISLSIKRVEEINNKIALQNYSDLSRGKSLPFANLSEELDALGPAPVDSPENEVVNLSYE